MSGLHAEIRFEREGFTLDFRLTIEPDTVVALLGPNGSGKSTAALILAGLVPLSHGRVVLDDSVFDDPSADVFLRASLRRIGMVFQDQRLFSHLSVAENIGFGPRALGASKEHATEAAKQWLTQLDLLKLSNRRPQELSGGQAQRVAIARALAIEPRLLVLDEPFSAIDVEARASLRTWLAETLQTVQCPTLLITHDPTDAFVLADRIDVIEDGGIVQSGTAEDLRRHPASPFVAALSGLNVLRGTANAGDITLSQGQLAPSQDQMALRTATTTVDGPVLITISPTAIALHERQPEGSPRNTWPTSIASLVTLGDRVRVGLDSPLPLSVDVTSGAVVALGLAVGSTVWASVKATEVAIAPAE